MDPVTCIGLAASILTFIDFSSSLVRGSYEVYKSSTGTTAENAHISNVVDDLNELVSGLETDLVGETKHEKALVKLAEQCQGLAGELVYLLGKLRANGESRWEAVKVKWKSMRNEKNVAHVEQRLRDYRSEISVRMGVMIW